MTEWAAFGLLKENLVTYFTGSTLILALAICLLFIIIFVSIGIDFRYAIVFTLPLLGAFLVGGWLVSSSGVAASWIVNALIILIGLFLAWVMIKIFT